MLVSRFAQTILVLACLTLAGCLQTENSNSLDATAFTGGGSPEFKAARAVFQQRCTSCHRHDYHARPEADFKALNCIPNNGGPCVVTGDANNSPLYYRMKNSGGPNGPKNMPTDGTVTNEELNIITTWMQTL